jgi:hypothetical protein
MTTGIFLMVFISCNYSQGLVHNNPFDVNWKLCETAFFLTGYKIDFDAEFERTQKKISVEHTLGRAFPGFEEDRYS